MANGAIVTFTVDMPGFKRQVDRIAKEFGVDSGMVMRDQMRLWLQDIIKNTPHKNATRKNINNAINNQIRSIFETTKTAAHLRWFRQKLRDGAWGANVDIFDEVPMADHHARHRMPNGKVRGIKGSVRVGPWEMSRKLHVTERDLRAYTRKKQADTGKLRAGWLSGLLRWGGTSPGSWITRHGDHGTSQDAMKADGSGYLESANNVKYNASKIDSAIRFTLRKRETDMAKHLEKRIEQMIARENARRA